MYNIVFLNLEPGCISCIRRGIERDLREKVNFYLSSSFAELDSKNFEKSCFVVEPFMNGRTSNNLESLIGLVGEDFPVIIYSTQPLLDDLVELKKGIHYSYRFDAHEMNEVSEKLNELIKRNI